MKNKVCDSCGYIGKPVHDEYSSLLLDAFIWAFGLIVAGITGVIPLVLLGPVFTVWHVLTFRSHRCPKCGNWEMHRLHDEHPIHTIKFR